MMTRGAQGWGERIFTPLHCNNMKAVISILFFSKETDNNCLKLPIYYRFYVTHTRKKENTLQTKGMNHSMKAGLNVWKQKLPNFEQEFTHNF